jgi:hypothetical protein
MLCALRYPIYYCLSTVGPIRETNISGHVQLFALELLQLNEYLFEYLWILRPANLNLPYYEPLPTAADLE